MRADFAFPSARVELWYPAALNPGVMVDYWGGEFTPLIGRLRPGVTLAQAKAEIRSLAAGVWRLFPFYMPRHWNANATVISLQTDLAGDARGRLLILLCAVGAVLVIACANVASLSMARATTRQREIALRAALGASRLRIVRQLLTESVVLALIAGAAGILLGAAALKLFRSVLSPDLAGAARVTIDWSVAGFTAGLSFVAGLSFGLAPALSALRLDLIETMKTGGQRSTPAGSLHVRSLLISAEVALTLVLVIAASLLSRSYTVCRTSIPGSRRNGYGPSRSARTRRFVRIGRVAWRSTGGCSVRLAARPA
jgi:putative ABC transport system permease protein